jgi:hypothetical protein
MLLLLGPSFGSFGSFRLIVHVHASVSARFLGTRVGQILGCDMHMDVWMCVCVKMETLEKKNYCSGMDACDDHADLCVGSLTGFSLFVTLHFFFLIIAQARMEKKVVVLG